uniref:Sugar phosphate transporter domain-containing protein n=1 Tax=Aplanochytrium stocchinoi TaxID=215587 RepID=A0A7S3LN47_9STRA
MWLLMNSGIFVFNTIYNRNFISKTDQTSDGINLIQQTFMVPIIIFWALFTGEVTIESIDIPMQQLAEQGWIMHLVLLGTCLGGCIIGAVYAECYKKFPATAVTVASNVIKFLSVFMGVYVFNTRLSFVQSLGLLLSIVAGVWYSILPKVPRTREAARATKLDTTNLESKA